jgi:hypothetical protein
MRRHLAHRSLAQLLLAVAVFFATLGAQASNPYALPEESPPPVAADGTIQWGVFYKDPAIQKAYERLWNLGACRNTNRAITIPVEENKLIIDRLPEADYEGRVVAVTGTLAGGMISFQQAPAAASAPLVAKLHPAAVTRLKVVGRAPRSLLRPGHVVRLIAEVDDKGRVAEPVTAFDIVTPPADFKPDPVRPGTRGEIVAAVRSLSGNVAVLHVPVGKVRRITIEISPDAIASLDAAQLDIIEPGDSIAMRGRIWTGEGSLGGGTVFASEMTVTKPAMPGEVAVAAPRQGPARP